MPPNLATPRPSPGEIKLGLMLMLRVIVLLCVRLGVLVTTGSTAGQKDASKQHYSHRNCNPDRLIFCSHLSLYSVLCLFCETVCSGATRSSRFPHSLR